MIGKIQSNIAFNRIYLEKGAKGKESDTVRNFKELGKMYDIAAENKYKSSLMGYSFADCLSDGLRNLDKVTEISGRDYYLVYRNHEYDSDGFPQPIHKMSILDSKGKDVIPETSSWIMTDSKNWLEQFKSNLDTVTSLLEKKLKRQQPKNSVQKVIDKYVDTGKN